MTHHLCQRDRFDFTKTRLHCVSLTAGPKAIFT